jgi:hypothetical protein
VANVMDPVNGNGQCLPKNLSGVVGVDPVATCQIQSCPCADTPSEIPTPGTPSPSPIPQPSPSPSPKPSPSPSPPEEPAPVVSALIQQPHQFSTGPVVVHTRSVLWHTTAAWILVGVSLADNPASIQP